MNTHRVYIASAFGDINSVRGPRKNAHSKAASRRVVKKIARRYDARYEAIAMGGSKQIANL